MKQITIIIEHTPSTSAIEIAIAKLLDNGKHNISTYMVEMFIKEAIYQQGCNWASNTLITLGNLDTAKELAPQLYPELY